MSALAVPPIPLSRLPERTKDYLLALANERRCTPVEAVKQTLDAAAESYMPPPPQAFVQVEEAETATEGRAA